MTRASQTRGRATEVVRAVFPTVIRAEGDEPGIIISTGAVDREGDIVVPEGCDLTAYQKNPVVLFAHDHWELPVGVTTSIDVTPQGIRAQWRWVENDERAARVRNAFEQGALRAASIGFMPTEWTDLRETRGRRYDKWELLEWSLVAVPANPEAVRVLRSLGFGGRHRVSGRLDRDGDETETTIEPPASVIGARRDLQAYLDGLEEDVRGDAMFNPIRTAIAQLTTFLNAIGADAKRLRGAGVLTVRDNDPNIVIVDDEDDVEQLLSTMDANELRAMVIEGIRDQVKDAFMQVTGRVDYD